MGVCVWVGVSLCCASLNVKTDDVTSGSRDVAPQDAVLCSLGVIGYSALRTTKLRMFFITFFDAL